MKKSSNQKMKCLLKQTSKFVRNPKEEGTPRTLRQAIVNGLRDGSEKERADEMVLHVRDFLGQKFNVAMMDESVTVTELWEKITGEKIP